jgi:hypothetical protein
MPSHDLPVAGEGMATAEMRRRTLVLAPGRAPWPQGIDGLERGGGERAQQLDEMGAALDAAEPGLHRASPAGPAAAPRAWRTPA